MYTPTLFSFYSCTIDTVFNISVMQRQAIDRTKTHWSKRPSFLIEVFGYVHKHCSKLSTLLTIDVAMKRLKKVFRTIFFNQHHYDINSWLPSPVKKSFIGSLQIFFSSISSMWYMLVATQAQEQFENNQCYGPNPLPLSIIIIMMLI